LASLTLATTHAPTLPSKPRVPPYPAGTCRTCDPLTPCPGQTCDPAACPSLAYPASLATRNFTACLSDFRATCADAANAGCIGCALWREVTAACANPKQAAVAPVVGRCVDWGDYALVPAREVLAGVDPPERDLCATATQWLLIPTRPCTGVESADPQCTGSAAERWWAAAWAEAGGLGLYAGQPPAGAAASPPTWGVIINPANRRSQHQTHFRIGWLNAALPPSFGDVMDLWRGTAAFSTDPAAPTVTEPTPGSAGPDPRNETQAPALASVFVPGGILVAKPWATAAVAAAAAWPAGRPYGVLVAPWEQQEAKGLVVAAMADLGSTQVLREDPGPGDCLGRCFAWGG